MNNWILPAFVAFVCWGIWAFIPKITTRYISPPSAMIYEAIGVGIMGIAVLIFIGFRPDVHVKGISLAVLTGILGISGALGFLFAVKSGIRRRDVYGHVSCINNFAGLHFFERADNTERGPGYAIRFRRTISFRIITALWGEAGRGGNGEPGKRRSGETENRGNGKERA